jgi:Ca-activated chloride channel family protein
VDSNLVLIPVSVVDDRGRAIIDLKLDDFELRVDGELKPLSDLSRAETPVIIALLFDNSASLSSARAFEKQAATRFFKSVVRKIDRAAVYSISTVPTLSQPMTGNVNQLVRTIDEFPQPEGATALFDTIGQAADYLRPFSGRKVIVLVSDGTDTVSDMGFDEALNRVLRSDSQVYVIQTRKVEEPNIRDPFSDRLIAKLTEQTGGVVYVPQATDDLDRAFSQIALDIGQQYLLSYYPQDEKPRKNFRVVGLRVKTRPGLRVRARKGFYHLPTQTPTPGASKFIDEKKSANN